MVIKDPHKRGIPHNDKLTLKPPVKTCKNYCKGDFEDDKYIKETFSDLRQKFSWNPKPTHFVRNILNHSFQKAFKKEDPPRPLCHLCKHSIGSLHKDSNLEVTHRFQDSYVEFINSKFSMCNCEKHCAPAQYQRDPRPEKYVYNGDSSDDMWNMQFKRWWGWNYGRKRDKYKRSKKRYWSPSHIQDRPQCLQVLENKSHWMPPRYYPHNRPRRVTHVCPRNFFQKLCLCCGYYDRTANSDEPLYHPPPVPYENDCPCYYVPPSRRDNYEGNKHLRQAWMKESSSSTTNCSVCRNTTIPKKRFPSSNAEYVCNRIYNIGCEGDPGDECCCCCPCNIETNDSYVQTRPHNLITESQAIQTEPQCFQRRCCKCCRAGCKVCVRNCQRKACDHQMGQQCPLRRKDAPLNDCDTIPRRNVYVDKKGTVPQTKIYKCCATQHEEAEMGTTTYSNILFSHVKTSPLFLDPIFSNPIARQKFQNSAACSKKHFIQPPPVLQDVNNIKNFPQQASPSNVIDDLYSTQIPNQTHIQNLLCNCPLEDLQHIQTLMKCKNITDKKPETHAGYLLKASTELKNAVDSYKPKTNFHTYNFLATNPLPEPCPLTQLPPIIDPGILSKLVGQVKRCDSLLQEASTSSDVEQTCTHKVRAQPNVNHVQLVTESETTVGDSLTSSEVTEKEKHVEFGDPVIQEIPLVKEKKKHSKTYLKLKKMIRFNQNKNKGANDQHIFHKEQSLTKDKKSKPNKNNLLRSSEAVKNDVGNHQSAIKFVEKYKALSESNSEMTESDLIISSRVVKNVMDNYNKLSTDINSEINESHLFRSSKVVKSMMDNYMLTSNFLEQCKKLSDVSTDDSNLLGTSKVPKTAMRNYTKLSDDINSGINENNSPSITVKNIMHDYKQGSDFLTQTSDFAARNNLRTVEKLSVSDDRNTEIGYFVEE